MKISELKEDVIYVDVSTCINRGKYMLKDNVLYHYNVSKKSCSECLESWNDVNKKEFREYEYIYNTIDAIEMLKIDNSLVFEYPVPNHIGDIKLIYHNGDVCISNGKFINKLFLSENHINMIWKKIC